MSTQFSNTESKLLLARVISLQIFLKLIAQCQILVVVTMVSPNHSQWGSGMKVAQVSLKHLRMPVFAIATMSLCSEISRKPVVQHSTLVLNK